jgi:hypothetical protein
MKSSPNTFWYEAAKVEPVCLWEKTDLARVWLTCKCNLQVLGRRPKKCQFCGRKVKVNLRHSHG